MPVDEDDPKLPINPYGASKLMTERMLADASAAYGFNYAALRYFNVSGADPEGRSGQVGKGSTHLIKVAVEAAVGKRDHVAVYGTDYPTPDGSCVRDYIHVSDLADAHCAALERLIERPAENLVLNCGYGRGLSVLEVLDALDRVLGKPVRRVIEGRRAGDPPQLVASNRALVETLDWTPRYADIDTIVDARARVGAKLAGGTGLMIKRAIFALAAAVARRGYAVRSAPTAADPAAAARIRAHVEFLADDLLEGRDTGSRGHDIAAAYVASQFRALGPSARRREWRLVPAGAVPDRDIGRARAGGGADWKRRPSPARGRH